MVLAGTRYRSLLPLVPSLVILERGLHAVAARPQRARHDDGDRGVGAANRRTSGIRLCCLTLALAALAAGCGDGGSSQPTVLADDIPVAHTPPGGYGDVMPAPILARCTEPLSADAPDLRGLWQTESAQVDGAPAPPEHPIWQHVERVEQCGNRVVITSSGVIHDMRADGTAEHGVNDVAVNTYVPIQVVATFEDGALVLRPVGVTAALVTRARDGDALVFHYPPAIVARLRRIDA